MTQINKSNKHLQKKNQGTQESMIIGSAPDWIFRWILLSQWKCFLFQQIKEIDPQSKFLSSYHTDIIVYL